MKDLLGSIGGAAGRAGSDAAAPRDVRIEIAGEALPGEGASGGAAGGGSAAGLGDFFAQVAAIKSAMAQMGRDLQQVRRLHEESKVATNTKGMQELRANIQERVDAVAVQARSVKMKLEALNDDPAGESGLSNAETRTRNIVRAGLSKRLKALMDEYGSLREQLRTEYADVVSRRVYTVTGERPSEEEVGKLIESGESEAIFQKATLASGRGHIMSVLGDIVEQKNGIVQLEGKLVELQQVFLDLAVLVEAQGDMLDSIETQVAKTVEYVQAGTVALTEAKTLQKRGRKMMCCVIVILLVIIMIIVVGVTKPWQDGKA